MAEYGQDAVHANGKSLLHQNRMFQVAKVSGVGLTASLILGFGVPKLNQSITRFFLEKERAEKAKAKEPKSALPALGGNVRSFNTNPSSPFGQPVQLSGSPLASNAFAASTGYNQLGLAATASSAAMANPFQGKNSVRFGGFGSNFLQTLQENDQMGTLLFSDLPLSSGRVVTARNTDERLEKLFKEVGIIATLFFIQQHAESFFAGSANHIGYPALKKLSELVKETGNLDQLKAQYRETQKQLGLSESTKLSEYFSNSQKGKEQIQHIRDYFNTNENHIPEKSLYRESNLLFDMAEAGGKIPTLQMVKDATKRNHIDITKEIDLDGVKAMAKYLDHLNGLTAQQFKQQLVKTAGHKMGAFAGAMAIGCGIMSWFIPTVQHYITFKRTGKDFFPGVQEEAQTASSVSPFKMH